MRYIKDYIEGQLGREVELQRDERGRWSIPDELIHNTDINFDRIVHQEK